MKYNKIIIVNVRSTDVRYMPSYELLLAEAIKRRGAGEEISIYTLMAHESPRKYIDRWRDADLVICWESFSTKAPTYVYSYFALARAVRKELGVPIYFGGFWGTSYGRYFDEFSVFDKIIEGYSMDALADALTGTGNEEERFINASGDSNYDKYPLDLSRLATPEKYIVDGCLYGYISSFSCTHSCTFCFANSARNIGGGFCARDIETVKKDIDALDDYFHFTSIVPKDLNIFYDRKRSFEFLDYLKEKGKKIDVNLDVTINDIDEDLFHQLSKFGIVEALYFGLESFNPEHRKKIGKPFSTEDLEKAFALADKYGINLTGNVILGLPWQTSEDVEFELQSALDQINRYKHVFIMLNVYKPEYGTSIQKEYFKDLHTKVTFHELVDIYLNNVSKYQSLVYGDQFNVIDIEKLFNAMRLVNSIKWAENRAPALRRKLLRTFRRRLEHQLRPPYFSGRIVPLLLKRNIVTFFELFMLPVLWIRPSQLNPLKIYRHIRSYTKLS